MRNPRLPNSSCTKTLYSQIAADDKLRGKFERVSISAKSDDDSFVGDKLSPDLRALVAGADKNRTVKVILQSDDIDNPQLLNVLKENGVRIGDRAEALCRAARKLVDAAARLLPATTHPECGKDHSIVNS